MGAGFPRMLGIVASAPWHVLPRAAAVSCDSESSTEPRLCCHQEWMSGVIWRAPEEGYFFHFIPHSPLAATASVWQAPFCVTGDAGLDLEGH